jgi:quercetin dioxygenase-like cupin family protein
VASGSHYRWSEIAPEKLNPLVTRQYIIGTNMMLARIMLKRGAVVPEHRHMNEQISHVLQGSLVYRIEGAETLLRSGEMMCLPPDVPHEVIALEDSEVLDIFNPPRYDWVDGNDAYLRSVPATDREGV